MGGHYFALSVTVGLAALVVPACIVIAKAQYSSLMRRCSAMIDLERVGTPREGGRLGGTAVVCGASVAGLMAARVCADHFARVVVVEPDSWILSDDARTGVPITGTRTVTSSSRGVEYRTQTCKRTRVYQYLSAHTYQVFLLFFLRKLFRGFDAKAKARGIVVAPADAQVYINGVRIRCPYAEYAARGEALPQTLYATRPTLESLLGALVLDSCPDIEYINGTAAGFTLAEDGSRVASVAVRLVDGTTQDIECSLVVDCTGNTQAGLKLLRRELSLPPRLRATYDPQMNLSGVRVPVPPGWDDALESMRSTFAHPLCPTPTRDIGMYLSWVVDPDVDHRTLAILRAGEDLLFCAYGWNCEMVVSLDDMREYAARLVGELPPPDFIPKMLDLVGPVADQSTALEFRLDSCSRIFYENAHRVLPRNFVAIGDATMRLNPRFGEGVTKAAVGAATLDGALRDHRGGPQHSDFGRAFFRRLADRTAGLWDMSKATDYGAATTTPVPGETRNAGALHRWYASRLLRAAAHDDVLASAFWHVNNFLAPTALLGTPRVMFAVFWNAAFRLSSIWD